MTAQPYIADASDQAAFAYLAHVMDDALYNAYPEGIPPHILIGALVHFMRKLLDEAPDDEAAANGIASALYGFLSLRPDLTELVEEKIDTLYLTQAQTLGEA